MTDEDNNNTFENTLARPSLASRVPAFEYAKCVNAWAGHHDYSAFDHSVILGAHPNLELFGLFLNNN
ncbi:hypothetical protein CAOG_009924 [Capsaspora owczarzaki ATCC 30864]|uniref:Uncharacterized protein n=1 Tax=Capsaspora owczarzaki (strain ATCC 30864) TaxID=595528 RepID=A0A0D2UK16_CAPO3|nr:hypothetical protein CAOG_009924 [Capsaspora owczarzaki ATCC 30864]